MKPVLAALALTVLSCSTAPPPNVDPQLAEAIAKIRAIDNHAHPVLPNTPNDQGFDALPVENLAPASDPVRFHPNGNPLLAKATQVLFNGDKAAAQKSPGASYAATILDRAGIDCMIANRVAKSEGLPPNRFLWAAYVDALLIPFSTAALEINSDRKAFFALEAGHLERYYGEAGSGPGLPLSTSISTN